MSRSRYFLLAGFAVTLIGRIWVTPEGEGEAGIHERLFGIAVIAGWLKLVRHDVAYHPVAHLLGVSLRQVFPDHGSNLGYRGATVFGKFFQIAGNGLGAALHDETQDNSGQSGQC